MKLARNLAIALIVALLQGQLTTTAEESHGVDKIEIKFVVKEADVAKAIEALGLENATAEKKTVYFFDTKDLSLFKQARTRVILRARTTAGERDREITVKLRSEGALEIEDEWLQKRRNGEKLDSKREKDQVVTKPVVHSYSLDDEEDSEEIHQAIQERRSVKKIFSGNQEDLVEAKTTPKLDWDTLQALGPIKVLKWEFEGSTWLRSAGTLAIMRPRWKCKPR